MKSKFASQLLNVLTKSVKKHGGFKLITIEHLLNIVQYALTCYEDQVRRPQPNKMKGTKFHNHLLNAAQHSRLVYGGDKLLTLDNLLAIVRRAAQQHADRGPENKNEITVVVATREDYLNYALLRECELRSELEEIHKKLVTTEGYIKCYFK